MKNKRRGGLLIIVMLLFVMLIIIAANIYNIIINDEENPSAEAATVVQMVEKVEFNEEQDSVHHLRDIDTLYENDGMEPVTMYLTVRTGNAVEGTNHTWEEINTYSAYYYDEHGIDRYKVDALLQVGNEDGILAGNLGYGRNSSNATVQIRGQTSSRNIQKNYKIELKKNQGSWNGQTTIALNKHQTDGLRFRNKMGFDLLKDIDQLMSLRTQFVHLYVNDLTDGSNDGFEDYGLYTQVEQLNKTALQTHGLDKNGQLYKLNFFEFFKYEDVIKLTSDPGYDVTAFEELLEIKGDTDHYKLIKMLDDLNDESMPIEEVIDRHFDLENLTYWMAFNILTGNIDTQSRNAYIYSPKNEDTWYFLSWDIDGMFRETENTTRNRSDYNSWECGVSNYWGNILFRRCLKSEKFRNELDNAINDLREGVLSRESLSEMVRSYRKVVEQYIWKEPDIKYERLSWEEYDWIAESIPDLMNVHYQNYMSSLEKPLPFYLNITATENGKIRMNWDESYDFQQEPISYKAAVSKDLIGEDIIYSYEGEKTEFTIDMLEPGTYFLKVSSYDTSGNFQDCFDYYVHEEFGKIYGTLCFYVNEDGTIEKYEVVE